MGATDGDFPGSRYCASGPRLQQVTGGNQRFVKADLPGRFAAGSLVVRGPPFTLAASHVCVTWLLQNTSCLCRFCNAGS